MSEKTTSPISEKQIAYIKSLANQLREHLSQTEVANLKSALADTSALTTKWGSSAIEKLKRIQTQATLAKLQAKRQVQSSSEG